LWVPTVEAGPVETSPAAGEVGRVIAGQWTLERLLGEGGMGSVYAARDAGGQRVAVKILHREMSARPEVRERFLREGRAATRVAHPGAVGVLAQALDGETAYLVMELLEGRSLSEVVNTSRVGVPELFGYLDQVLDVLAKAHAQGIVHRDLKPDNLFVTSDGRVKVLDFGIAKFLEGLPPEQRTRTGITMGTLSYMAPEQALGRGDQIDGRTDLYALGAMAFRILAGRRVHEGLSDAEVLVATITKPAPPLAVVAPQLPAGACAVVDLALAFDRLNRYENAAAMQEDVRAVLAGKAPAIAQRSLTLRDEPTSSGVPSIVYAPASFTPTELGEVLPPSSALPLPVTEPDVPSIPRSRVARTLVDDGAPLQAPLWLWLVAALVLIGLGSALGLAFSGDSEEAPAPAPSGSAAPAGSAP
jgi:eukaryotic-like serine/threonine-protein kinase